MVALFLLGFLAAAEPLVCPRGAELEQRTDGDAREQWCALPDGTREGPRRGYYGNGAVWFEGAYHRGKREGIWRFWYPGGKLRTESLYNDDRRNGEFVQWNEFGQRVTQGLCERGRATGKWQQWWPNGKLAVEAFLKNGHVAGTAHYWNRRGRELPIDTWISETTRSRPNTERFSRLLERYARNAGFDYCGE